MRRRHIRMKNNNTLMKRYLLSAILLAVISVGAGAQSGTNSPYSQYGLGVMADQSQGMNRGMAGLGIGMRMSNQVNTLNPASYSGVDSLTMLFDAGLSLSVTNFEEGNRKLNANTANFEYFAGSFRLMKNLGLGFGVLPFTNIGYEYTTSSTIDKTEFSTTTSTETYAGEGGVHQILLGLGWQPLKGLSIGVNASYLYGSYEKSISITSSDSYVNTVTKTYQADIKSYLLQFGLQYQRQIGKKDMLTLGLTYTDGHGLKAKPTYISVNSNPQTSVATSDTLTLGDGLYIPDMFGVGLSWVHGRSLTVGFDYTLQKWGGLDYPEVNVNTGEYEMVSGKYLDRHKYTLGAEYVANENSRKFLQRVRVRIGASYNTPYIKVNGIDGPKEYSLSLGLGIPIMNGWNNRSMLNISGQWTKASSKELITENTFRINVGFTFNERWFMKWKVE